MNKKYFSTTTLILFVSLFACALILLVSGAVSNIAPIVGTNHSTNINWNFTYTNGSGDIVAPLQANSSLYCNTTGTWAELTISNWSIDVTTVKFSTAITTANDGTGGCTFFLGNETNSSADGLGAGAYVGNHTPLTFDTTGPAVTGLAVEGITTYLPTGQVTLNVTVNDSGYLIAIDTVYFNITNASGRALTLNASLIGSDSYNATLNVSALSEGFYNITVWTNDTDSAGGLGNVNNTEYISVIIDRTSPTLTYDCTPDPVDEGETTTCSCSATDAHSGVNTSYETEGYSYATTTPSTTSSGTFTVSCSTRDLSENSASITTTYTVVGIGGVGRSSGGSSSTTTTTTEGATYAVTESEFNNGYSRDLNVNDKLEVYVSKEKHIIEIIEVGEDSVTIIITSEPQQIILEVGEEKKVDADSDGVYDTLVKLNSIEAGKADITVKSIYEEIPIVEPEPEVEESSSLLWVLLGAVVLGIVIVVIVKFLKKKE